jgi:hypothetical protein
MAANRDEMTLADYVAIALSPFLIMALVGSLVFLLLEVLYQGQYQARLQWILFFFVFGAVLVSRISMTNGISERAGIYGLILGALTWFALAQFVEYPPDAPLSDVGWLINLGLILIIWWSAHRLTWDCTLIDDSVDASGVGLLDAAGLDANASADELPAEEGKRKKKRKAKEATGLIGWWERYLSYRAEMNKRPHTPGVWVVYFSLAALPIFGIGQSLIPPSAADRRQYVFWLMVIYVASGLGLLLATSFLGLRRYLRQKKLQMPIAATSVWLMIGGTLIAVLLFLGALLPRPNAEYRMLPEWLAGSPERDASNWAMMGGKAGKGKGREISEKSEEGKDGSSSGKDKGQGKDGKGQGKSGGGKGKDKGSGQGKEKGQSGGDKQGDKSQGGDKQGDKSQGGDAKGDKSSGGKGEKSGEKSGRDGGKGKQGQGKSGEKKEGDGSKKDGQQAQQQQPQQRQPPQSGTWRLQLPTWLTTLLKWVVGIIVGLLVLFVLLRALLKFLANFTDWAKNLLAGLRSFWDNLWGLFPGGRKKRERGEKEEAARRELPFAFFRDPFLSGEAAGHSPEELVRYTFDALEAWARERHLARREGETPLEFAERVGDEVPALEGDLLRLAEFYVRVVYARVKLPEGTREPLRRFWQLLRAVVERPMSASVDG